MRERFVRFQERLASGEHLKKTWPRLRPVSIVLASLLIVVLLFVGLLSYANGQLFGAAQPGSTQPVLLVVRSGQSLTSVTRELQKLGLVNSTWGIKLLADFTNRSNRIKSGEYVLTKSMTAQEILDMITQPAAPQLTVRVTLVEGALLTDFAAELEAKGVISDAASFLAECRTAAQYTDYYFMPDLLKREGVKFHLEGFLFPDTYEFYANSTNSAVIKKLLSRFSAIYTPAFSERAKTLGMSMNDVVALASVIEKEGRTKDFTKISAVFHNRIQAGMRLESDATIQYALGVKRLVLTADEMKTDSPYNTYLNSGYTPGPICNPGQKAIEAALYPDEEIMAGKYYYFLLTDPYTGEVAYSKTGAEHNKLKEKYRELWKKYDAENNG